MISECVVLDLIYCFLSSMLLRYAFSRLRSTQVAAIHCSAQTSSRHVLQKLSQTCLLLSSNTGRVFRPKDCENLVLYLKDINLPKPDKWGTSNLTAFLQQVEWIHCQKDRQTNKQIINEWMDVVDLKKYSFNPNVHLSEAQTLTLVLITLAGVQDCKIRVLSH